MFLNGGFIIIMTTTITIHRYIARMWTNRGNSVLLSKLERDDFWCHRNFSRYFSLFRWSYHWHISRLFSNCLRVSLTSQVAGEHCRTTWCHLILHEFHLIADNFVVGLTHKLYLIVLRCFNSVIGMWTFHDRLRRLHQQALSSNLIHPFLQLFSRHVLEVVFLSYETLTDVCLVIGEGGVIILVLWDNVINLTT
jgi:general stress protein CsbA